MVTQPIPVDPELIEIVHQELGEAPKKIVVTGGTGFVGARLAQVLCDAGHAVTIAGRSPYRVRSDGKFVACDLTSAKQAIAICKNQEIVFHSAALTSPWGSLALHRAINTRGTQNVIDGCLQSCVERLVHVSSTAIFFQFKDRTRVTDETEFPEKFCNPYAQSKAEAELLVQDAIKEGLNAYIVRARAVFGPGDNALLPRLINAAEGGRLRQIGDGKNLCDLTYVDNLVAGLVKAANPNRPTGVCTITNEEPARLWELLHQVLKETTDNPPNKSIPYGVAINVAKFSEWKHRLLRLPGEPPLTQYGVGLLAKEQTFESDSAKSDLDYQPIVTLNDGIDRTIKSIRMRSNVHENESTKEFPCVTVKFFSTGYVEFKRKVVERLGGSERTRFHASVALIHHPKFGTTLFDTGYSCRFYDVTKSFPNKLYALATKVFTKEDWSIESWLLRENIDPTTVDRVLLSHFHADHICGIAAFPNSDFVTFSKAWESVKNLSGFAAVRRGFLPQLLPSDFADRLHTINALHWPGIGPFRNCHDLFGDGSVRLFDLDGHANGQMGALLRESNGKLTFLVADTFWTQKEVELRLDPTFAFNWIAENPSAARKSRIAVMELAALNPEIQIVCSHCPEFAAKQKFDEQLNSIQ